MQSNYLLYYLLRLINKGNEWKNKDLNGQVIGRFSLLQVVAVILAGLYVWKQPSGMADKKEIIDFILSSLSITTALLFSIIVVVLDRVRQHKFDGRTEPEMLNDIHQWNHLYQFAAITGNAILWSLLVIVLLICSMLFGHNFNLQDYAFVGWSNVMKFVYIHNFLIYVFVAGVRFIIVYGLFNFFILFLFALVSLFESITSELDSKQPKTQVSLDLMGKVDSELNKLITPVKRKILWGILLAVFLVSVSYLF